MSGPAPIARPPRRAITGRALVLGTVIVLLIILLASPLNRYFASRTDVSQAAAQLHQDTARLNALKAEQLRWGDPGYVEAQARLRLEYAMPGDTVYQVVNHGAKNDIDKTITASAKAKPTGTWNAKLWGSVTSASGTS
jgi:cell division protein FtsB